MSAVTRESPPEAVDAVERQAGERRAWHQHLWRWYLGAAGIMTALYLFLPPLVGNGPLINLLGLSSPIAIAVGVLIHRPRQRIAWWLFALGQFLFFAGDTYTYSYPKLAGVDVPFPSAGDAIYLTVYPALMAGLLVLVKSRNPRRDRAALIDAMILTIGVSLLSWVFLIEPNAHLSGLSWLAKSVSAAYPLGDLLLLAAVIRLAVDAGKRAPAFYLLMGSIICLFVTDSAYAYALLVDGYNHQLSFDVGWILYFVLWGAAALHPSMRTLDEPAQERRSRLTWFRLVLLGSACLIAPCIRVAQSFDDSQVLVVICASALLFLLVVARMAGLVRHEERATSRERALRGAGAKLVAAAGADQVHEATTSAVRELLGPRAAVRLVLVDGDTLVVVAASESDEGWPLGPEASGWLRGVGDASFQTPLVGVPERVRGQLRLETGETLLVLALSVRDDVLGMIVVCSPAGIVPELVDSLEALAVTVSLALEGASLAEDLHRRKSEARFRSLVAHASDLITVLDANGAVTYQSPSIERVLGYRVDEVEGTHFEDLLSETDRPRLAQIVGGVGGGATEMHAMECSLRHRDGTWLQFEVQATDLLHDEHVRGVVLNSRDVSERKAFEDQLAHQAFHDPVTNLANRALFSDRVQHALMRAQRSASTVAVMFIDLDDFKTVNDSLGHAAGDHVLQEVAGRLARTVRPTDTVARFGGDEFAVLLDGIKDSPEAADAAARILRALEIQVEIEGKQVFPRASVGISMVGPDGAFLDAEELLRNADLAMYMAKRDSKGSYRMFEPAMHERVLERLELRSDLQQAIQSNELEVHYQPVVHLHREEIAGVEALLRWPHPTRGQILPDQFIPIAEETGLIVPIGRWVIDKACRDGALLQRRFPRPEPLTMSVNLSVKQLQSETVVTDVRKALERSGLPPSTLVLEITESVMLADTELAVRRLQDLKALGIRLAMDDFGTGYSSLSYLGQLPVDILKMDRSFLASRKNDSLTSAIIALGANLTLEVVAEGIERPEQAASMRQLGCGFGQGFLFGKAMSNEALLDFLQSDSSVWARIAEPPESDAA
jgi:diguanylate cyclase (GGDEF)-like protein/PAS domain S-box-containing protein